eukprot:1649554-Rhodomonas_salina.1
MMTLCTVKSALTACVKRERNQIVLIEQTEEGSNPLLVLLGHPYHSGLRLSLYVSPKGLHIHLMLGRCN